jgi:hypothetical protein
MQTGQVRHRTLTKPDPSNDAGRDFTCNRIALPVKISLVGRSIYFYEAFANAL